jgi:acylphosphatase
VECDVILAHRLRIYGRVQGVGFRAFVYREAKLAGCDGWVRNRTDGTVEAVLWGNEETIDALLMRIEEGPRWGRVDRVEITIESGAGERPAGFEIRSDR